MSLTPQDLDALREGWDFEVKAAQGRDGRGAVPGSFWDAHPRDITLKLQELVRRGLLDSSGRTRSTTYAPHTDPGASTGDSGPSVSEFGASAGDSGPSASDSGPSAGKSGPSASTFGTSSGGVTPGAGGAGSSSHSPDGAGIEPRDRVHSIATRPWVRHEVLDAAIVDACRGGFRTAREIADRVGRAHITVRRRLGRLVAEGRLERRFPGAARHARQTYRAVDAPGREP